MQEKFNFRIDYRRTNQWTDTEVFAHNVSGVLKFLHKREAAFMMSPYRLTVGRAEFADVTAVTWSPDFRFLFRHPKSSSIHSQYLVPFELSVWAALTLSILLISIILAIHLQRSGAFETVHDRSFVGVLLWLYSFAVQQFSGDLPRLNASRIILTAVMLLSFICYQYYNTFIVASLIIEQPKTIKTLTDLIKSGLDMGTTTAVYNRDLFTSVSNYLARKSFPDLLNLSTFSPRTPK